MLPNSLPQGAAQELSKEESPVQGEQPGETAARRTGLRNGRNTKWARGAAVSGTQARVGHSPASAELEATLGRGLSTGSLSCAEIRLCCCRLRATLLPKPRRQGGT